ncbi:hypothetical protein AB0K60_00895 [Thermopolyspora sp. NPDC052614]|uniref:hypothetical protein n=1 Tax=Thermopolyspora sp. NPDC052614 TaxID=3155682 RepID=UPI0034290C5E
MGVTEVDRVRARRTLRIVERPWADPALDEAVDAVRRRYLYAGVGLLAATRLDPEVRAQRVEALSHAAVGQSRDIATLLAADQSNPDMWLWLGRTLVEEAWLLRPDVRARSAQAGRQREFHQAMERAREPLRTAARLLPADPVPWESLMWMALGLDAPRAEKDALWAECARRFPTLFPANVARLITLSPGWGGTTGEMFEFARVAVSRAPEGDPLPALVPLAHFERNAERSGGRHWFDDEALREIVSAAGSWVERRRMVPHPRAIEAHNLFGAAFYLADLRRPARGHLVRTGGRVSRLPWSHLGEPRQQYLRACGRLNIVTT